ncbi:hypothetical protein TIFTF001_029481 [Ficus carica]|uniref:Uncharacterized protein n=1 Tax=Ficus carica TaxID=3494 RepID=A0AA88DRY1_FICCA|nr:hypothetical protein TIFTF001_029481 [Ficus carica]
MELWLNLCPCLWFGSNPLLNGRRVFRHVTGSELDFKIQVKEEGQKERKTSEHSRKEPYSWTDETPGVGPSASQWTQGCRVIPFAGLQAQSIRIFS